MSFICCWLGLVLSNMICDSVYEWMPYMRYLLQLGHLDLCGFGELNCGLKLLSALAMSTASLSIACGISCPLKLLCAALSWWDESKCRNALGKSLGRKHQTFGTCNFWKFRDLIRRLSSRFFFIIGTHRWLTFYFLPNIVTRETRELSSTRVSLY